jgi:hypothetical protein
MKAPESVTIPRVDYMTDFSPEDFAPEHFCPFRCVLGIYNIHAIKVRDPNIWERVDILQEVLY